VTRIARTLASAQRGESKTHPSAQTRSLVDLSARIGKDGKGQLLTLEKVSGHERRAVSNGHQIGPLRANLSHSLGQASHLLAAKNSAKVSKKDQDRRSLGPDLGQGMRASFRVQDGQRLQDFQIGHDYRLP